LWPVPQLVIVLLLRPPLQKHYDFGMRALKAVLVMAGSLKRRSPNVPEEIVLIQAMRDANLPKLLSEVRLAAAPASYHQALVAVVQLPHCPSLCL
jgi:hypothetical protein